MYAKKETTRANILSIYLLYFISGSVSFYTNALMILILKDPAYYDIPESEIGRTTGTILFWSNIIPIIFFPFYAFIFELIGRRIPLLGGIFLLAITCFFYPWLAPNALALVVLRVAVAMITTLFVSCPLINDYIKKESRGLAVTYQAMSIGISITFTALILVPATQKLDFT